MHKTGAKIHWKVKKGSIIGCVGSLCAAGAQNQQTAKNGFKNNVLYIFLPHDSYTIGFFRLKHKQYFRFVGILAIAAFCLFFSCRVVWYCRKIKRERVKREKCGGGYRRGILITKAGR